ncbi:MAG: cell division ATP-binding protein FtsE [Ignavibacteria bacterium GWA2_55_11]|nr:MAG: cell division ATP-binding protein FtsE [Ignavibacteria bacterium GWA2_55_11]OGU45706.1 MAG: cell division ATP-binding protein FtsE [Ignavibacteria bacterium GWC2_56_12]OGU66274.1 MAG: cell division ATP-binding protein FtsE [Ignavibacteria bacterium RIFCSPHIGHO2_02_FULL_56_12]OGU70078.1 MAG: cell division ATP-binding protein FtsE [Ignavibacteria bacterium RIFCSPLOWO2_02_FULL_55_14]OGU72083.1 MAG: cell division ATP-binding protein FtsE [Ignavibacteria bacterium RIFCSPLOWO2_12_FULL_56_21]
MIEMHDVTVSFDGQPVLDGVSFTMKRGEFVYLVGQTGAGKSSLMRLLYFDLSPSSGRVRVAGYNSEQIAQREIPYLRRRIGIVFQDFKLLEDRSVYDNVSFALHVTNARTSDIKKRVLHVLADVGLSHKRNQMPHELSGGEQQRVVIARALINEPAILIADEPTGNLDPASSAEIMELITKINMRGTAILMATHNYELVKRYPARVVQLKEGRLHEVDLKIQRKA